MLFIAIALLGLLLVLLMVVASRRKARPHRPWAAPIACDDPAEPGPGWTGGDTLITGGTGADSEADFAPGGGSFGGAGSSGSWDDGVGGDGMGENGD